MRVNSNERMADVLIKVIELELFITHRDSLEIR